jgi:hypothetical protein
MTDQTSGPGVSPEDLMPEHRETALRHIRQEYDARRRLYPPAQTVDVLPPSGTRRDEEPGRRP